MEEYEQPTLGEKLGPIFKKLLPLIAILVVIGIVAFVWLYVIPWPATLRIAIVEKDTGDPVPGATAVISGAGPDIIVSPEEGPVNVPSRTKITISSEKIAGYSIASTSIETEAGKEYNVMLELARSWRVELSGPSSIALPQACKIEVAINVKNNENKELALSLLAEGIDEKYSPAIFPREQKLPAGETKVFTLQLTAPVEKEVEETRAAVRVKKTDSKLSFTLKPIAKVRYDVSPREINCKESSTCYEIVTVTNQGDALLPVLVETSTPAFPGGSIQLLDLPADKVITVSPGGSYKFGVSITTPAGDYLAWLIFNVASKGCAIQQIPIKRRA